MQGGAGDRSVLLLLDLSSASDAIDQIMLGDGLRQWLEYQELL